MHGALYCITRTAMRYIEEAHNLTDLWTRILEVDKLLTSEAFEALDFTDLPTYGGDPIPVAAGVWSWDRDRVLVSSWLTGEDDAAAFTLVTRAQLELLVGDRRVCSRIDGDTGTVVRIEGHKAVVSWDQGIRLPALVSDLERI